MTNPIPKNIKELIKFLEFEYFHTDPINVRGNSIFNAYEKSKHINELSLSDELKQLLEDSIIDNVSITKNKYPYKRMLSKLKAKHYVIWNIFDIQNFTPETLDKTLKKWLKLNKFHDHKYILFKNDARHRSIKYLDHYQLFLIPKKLNPL
jgi:hypothetical protein